MAPDQNQPSADDRGKSGLWALLLFLVLFVAVFLLGLLT